MKPVIILAKGPSARFLPESDKYEVATVNKDEWIKAVIRKRTHELQSTYCG